GRRCDHEGTHSARRGNAVTRAVSPRRDTCFCARANGGIQAAPREPDRALLRGHSMGGGRCAARAVEHADMHWASRQSHGFQRSAWRLLGHLSVGTLIFLVILFFAWTLFFAFKYLNSLNP